MFFIVSTGRSGSTSIAHAITQIEGCHAVHEPAPELILEASGYRQGTTTREAVEELLRSSRQPVVDGQAYCESNQNLALIIPILRDCFPEARFIWLIRNGMDMVASAMQKQWYSGHSENHDRYEDGSPLERAWIDGRLRGDAVGVMTTAEWDPLSRFAKICWYWDYVNRLIEKDLQDCPPEQVFRLRLEDVDSRQEALLDWMGFASAHPEWSVLNAARRAPLHWTGWSAQEMTPFQDHCGALMEHHYPGWKTLVESEAARILIKPLIRSLLQQNTDATERAETQAERQEKRLRNLKAALKESQDSLAWNQGHLRWYTDHWSHRWYLRVRRCFDRGDGGNGSQ